MRPYVATEEEVQRFREERERFKLVYKCQDCAFVNKEDLSCTFGYPNETLLKADVFLDKVGRFVFCKYFEV